MIYLSIATTGIDPNKNRIYLINILENGRYRGLWGDPKTHREEILSLGNKEIITFNGEGFDLTFIAKKTDIQLTSFDMYRYLKGNKFYEGATSTKEWAKKLDLEDLPSVHRRLKVFKEYEQSGKGKEQLLQWGEQDIRLRQEIHKNIESWRKKYRRPLGEGFAELYSYRKRKDFFTFLYQGEEIPKIDLGFHPWEAKGEGEKLEIRFPVVEGYIAPGEKGKCIAYPLGDDGLVEDLQIIEKQGQMQKKKIQTIGLDLLHQIGLFL
ncbi:MAG: ribonuclease H-like domain-containing protein [Tissierellia bacterium]|nr:ribonuclease H-like domain-containing protein [Tissierellia bacterium]